MNWFQRQGRTVRVLLSIGLVALAISVCSITAGLINMSFQSSRAMALATATARAVVPTTVPTATSSPVPSSPTATMIPPTATSAPATPTPALTPTPRPPTPTPPPLTATPHPPTPTLLPPTPTTQVEAPPQVSPEHTLAVLQQGTVREDDPVIAQFKQQLDELELKCTEDRGQLADLTATAHDQLAQKGINETPLALLTTLNATLPAGIGPVPCADAFGAYVLVRTGLG